MSLLPTTRLTLAFILPRMPPVYLAIAARDHHFNFSFNDRRCFTVDYRVSGYILYF